MKEDFEAEDRTLSALDVGLKSLTTELESAAAEAERAAAAETAAGSNSADIPLSVAAPARSSSGSVPERLNPYSKWQDCCKCQIWAIVCFLWAKTPPQSVWGLGLTCLHVGKT